MTASTITAIDPRGTTTAGSTWRNGAAAGLAPAAATVAVATGASHLGVSLQTAPGKVIPVLAFGQLTLFFTAVGVLIARAMGRWVANPRTTFIKTAIVLTVLSLMPDLALPTGAGTKLTLLATHLVAAAIVIPTLSAGLGATGWYPQ